LESTCVWKYAADRGKSPGFFFVVGGKNSAAGVEVVTGS
jgi:hypothetical protein